MATAQTDSNSTVRRPTRCPAFRATTVLLVLLGTACDDAGEQRGDHDVPDPASETIEAAATSAVAAIRDRDFDALADRAHPEKGVRFTPYAYVQPDADRSLLPAAIRAAGQDTAAYRWGTFDGTGGPIMLTAAEYFDRFVYDADFAAVEQVGYGGDRIGRGNSIDNAAEVYPDGTVVEYHFPGFDPDFGGMDWRSLRLVFEQWDSRWYLVAVIHDEWTI